MTTKTIPHVKRSAYMRQENRFGSIEVDKRADLIVLDRNLFKTPIRQISQTWVEQTLSGWQTGICTLTSEKGV